MNSWILLTLAPMSDTYIRKKLTIHIKSVNNTTIRLIEFTLIFGTDGGCFELMHIISRSIAFDLNKDDFAIQVE